MAQLKESIQHNRYELRGLAFYIEQQEAEWNRLEEESQELEKQTKQLVAELELVGGSLSGDEEPEGQVQKGQEKGVPYRTRRNIHQNYM